MDFVRYTPFAGQHVADNMKHWDGVETDITHKGWNKYGVIKFSVARSDIAYSVMDGDSVVAVGGIGGDDKKACIWMLSTPAIEKKPKRVMELSRQFLQLAKDLGYTKVFNFVHPDNKVTMRWLMKLGFKINKKPNAKGLIKVEKDLWNQ